MVLCIPLEEKQLDKLRIKIKAIRRAKPRSLQYGAGQESQKKKSRCSVAVTSHFGRSVMLRSGTSSSMLL